MIRSHKPSGNFKLSSIISGLVVITIILYCVYILPLLLHSKVDDSRISERPKYELKVVPLTPEKVSPVNPVTSVSNTKELEQINHKPDVNIYKDKEVKTDRPKFPEPISFSSSYSPKAKSVLVVGGTDGSGTRRVVQILAQLGVVMVSEDPETYDIHADLVRGWPEVVTPVISAAHTLDYSPRALSAVVQQRAQREVGAILGQVEKDSTKPTSYKLAVGGVLPHPAGVTASSVLYGFKAPVAMTLSPWFAELSPHFKLVHVLRDGRDLSFSANQGPVTKFFNAMYGGQNTQMSVPVKSIKLWSDWNAQVNKWARRYRSEVEQINSRDKSFGYFAVHSEDMVHPSVPVRFAAISHLAGFVGSSLTPLQVCCLALQEASFMGSHDRTPMNPKAGGAAVSKRYGKWHALLAKDPQLSETLHREGKEGLEMFGYQPERPLADESMQSAEGFQCREEEHREQCGIAKRLTFQEEAQAYAIQGVCTVKAGFDYIGGDIDAVPLSTPDQADCCRQCKQRPECKYFVVDPNTNMCYLKRSSEGTKENTKLISGAMS